MVNKVYRNKKNKTIPVLYQALLLTIINIAHLPVENYTPDESKNKFVIAINNVSSTNVYQLNLKHKEMNINSYFKINQF